jgi:PPK2 family polyphosphate:nucleotide phosphotransferase
MNHNKFIVPPGKKISLKNFDPAYTGKFGHKQEAEEKLLGDIQTLAQYQDVLYAQDTYALLIIIQAMDAAGKDSVIKHVMSGVNPQGCRVVSFKAPSAVEVSHDFLWRCSRALPPRGQIGIFNRSYYEEVLVARVHPEILGRQKIPPELLTKKIWAERFEAINDFERYLTRNGTVILKFFLHVSKHEQKRRFLERIESPDKHWKFSADDIAERAHWRDYQRAYEDLFRHTSTAHAPWHVIPADHKWFTRVAVSDIINTRLRALHLKYPVPDAKHEADLRRAQTVLEKEENGFQKTKRS